MSRERIVLGRRADVAETAERLSVSVWANTARTFDRERLVKNAVERVRRHFGRRNKARGDKYAKVAYAYQAPQLAQDGLAEAHIFPRPEKSQKFFRRLQTKGEIDNDRTWTGEVVALNRGFARCRRGDMWPPALQGNRVGGHVPSPSGR